MSAGRTHSRSCCCPDCQPARLWRGVALAIMLEVFGVVAVVLLIWAAVAAVAWWAPR